MIPAEARDDACPCGDPVAVTMIVRYRYPRAEWVMEAMDPYYVHGTGGFVKTCGDPRCEPDAFLACLERAGGDHLTAEEAAGLEVMVVEVAPC
jgi:hypothetical protein